MIIMHSQTDNDVFLKPSLQRKHGLSSCFQGCAKGSLSSEPTSVLDLACTISPASSPGTSPSYLNNPGNVAAPSLHKSIVHKSYHQMQNSGIYNGSLQSLSQSRDMDCSAASSLPHSMDAFELSSTLSDGCDGALSRGAQNESLQEIIESLQVDLDFEVDTKSSLEDIFADSPSSFIGNDPNVWDEALLAPDEFIHMQGSISESMGKALSSRMQEGQAQYNNFSSPNNCMCDIFCRAACHFPECRIEKPSIIFEQGGQLHDESCLHMHGTAYGQSTNKTQPQTPCSTQFTTNTGFAEYPSCFNPVLGNCNLLQCNCSETPWMECTFEQASSTCSEPSTQEEHGLELVHLLLLCARMIGQQHNKTVQPLLRRLQKMSSPHGEPLERISHYVSEAMFKRVANEISHNKEPPMMMVQPPQLPLADHSTSLDQHIEMELDGFHLALYQALPYTKFLHFTANQAILEAVAGSSHIHVIDFDIQQGIQWPNLFQSLAIRPQGVPKTITMSAIGKCNRRLNQTGKMLAEFAKTLNLNFTFYPIATVNVKAVDVGMFASRNTTNNGRCHKTICNDTSKEAIALNLSDILHSPMWEGVTTEMVLNLVRKLHPKVITIIKAERQNEAVSYVDKFTDMLFYHSAFFDSMEASLGRRSQDRETIERVFLSYGLKSMIDVAKGKEEENMIMNFSTEKWQALMNGHGFHSVQFSNHALYQAKLLLNLYASEAFRVECSHATSALSINWQQIPLFSVLAFSSNSM